MIQTVHSSAFPCSLSETLCPSLDSQLNPHVLCSCWACLPWLLKGMSDTREGEVLRAHDPLDSTVTVKLDLLNTGLAISPSISPSSHPRSWFPGQGATGTVRRAAVSALQCSWNPAQTHFSKRRKGVCWLVELKCPQSHGFLHKSLCGPGVWNPSSHGLSPSLVSLTVGVLTPLGSTSGLGLTVPLTSATPARRASLMPGDLITCLVTVLWPGLGPLPTPCTPCNSTAGESGGPGSTKENWRSLDLGLWVLPEGREEGPAEPHEVSAGRTTCHGSQVPTLLRDVLSFFKFLAATHCFQDLSSPTRDWTQASAVKSRSSNHWTTKEVPKMYFLDTHLPSRPLLCAMGEESGTKRRERISAGFRARALRPATSRSQPPGLVESPLPPSCLPPSPNSSTDPENTRD